MNLSKNISAIVLLSLIFSLPLVADEKKMNEEKSQNTGGKSYISEEYIPFLYEKKEDDPGRNHPLSFLTLGDRFLGNGNLHPGFQLPTGAVWQPRLWFFGNSRTSIHTYDLGQRRDQVSEWATRLDLFANLQLTGTERIVIGVEPFHRGTDFFGERFRPEASGDFRNPTNLRLRTLFFEGDLAEVFPNFDPLDTKGLDIGFSIGRQDVVFQDGLLINDTIDGIGLTKNSIRFDGVDWLTNLRVTAFYGFNEVNRDDNQDDNTAKLYGLFTAADTVWSTFEADVVYVDSHDNEKGDLLAWGLSSTKRLFEHYNWTVRYVGSKAMTRETRQSEDGHLFFSELSWTPYGTNDVMYVNGFVGIDNYTSPARDTLAGGPLGRTGILFAARGIGSYPAPLSNRAQRAFGAAIGYQKFFDNNTQHILVETGFRRDTSNDGPDFVGVGAQWQKSFNDNYIIQIDSFLRGEEDGSVGWGLRTEFQIKF